MRLGSGAIFIMANWTDQIESGEEQAIEARLRDSQAELEALLCALTDVVLVLSAEGRYLKIAETGADLLARPADELLGRTVSEIFDREQADIFLEHITRALETEKAVALEYSLKIGAERRWFAAMISPMSNGRVVWVARDVTEARKGMEALQRAEARYRGIFENAVEGIFQTAPDGRYVTVNPSLARIYGYDSPAELIDGITDIKQQLYVEPGRRDEFIALMQRHDAVSRFESQVRRRDGAIIWISENARSVRDDLGALLFYEGTTEDITERKRQEEAVEEQQSRLQEINVQLEALATLDSLTGLKNHRALQDRLRAEMNRSLRDATPLSVVLLDVDRFKPYNDTFGHPAGDRALRQIARLLEENARDSDLVARYGGEEFVVLLPNTDREGALILAERFRAAIENADWKQRAVTASFGVSTLVPGTASNPPETESESTNSKASQSGSAWIKAADKALYWSKAGGRNRVTHADDPPLN